MAYRNCDVEDLLSSDDDNDEISGESCLTRLTEVVLESLIYSDDEGDRDLHCTIDGRQLSEVRSELHRPDQHDVNETASHLLSWQLPDIGLFPGHEIATAPIYQTSDDGNDDYFSAAILDAVLDDSDRDDDVEVLTEENGDSYLTEFERAAKREQRYLFGDVCEQRCNPLFPSNTVSQYQSAPVGRLSYFALDAISALSGLKDRISSAHIHSSHISIGTSEGLVVVYNHDQSVQVTLSATDISSPVTVIDISDDKKYVVCGYGNGIIALWTIQRGLHSNLLLMYIDDLHHYPLKFLEIITQPMSRSKSDSIVSFISSDDSGATHRVRIKKSLFAKYSYESECLLNGSSASDTSANGKKKSNGNPAAVITCMSLLRPLPTSADTELSRGWIDIELMAFSTPTKAFIVQLRPTVMILHRWQVSPHVAAIPTAPQASETETEIESDDDSVKSVGSSANNSTWSSNSKSANTMATTASDALAKADQLPDMSLDWTWTVREGKCCPLLLRSCGPSLQVLSLTLAAPLAKIEGGSVTKSRKESGLTFSVTDGPMDGVAFITACWIEGDPSRIVALSETHIHILSYPTFIEIEKILLPPDMAYVLKPRSQYSSTGAKCVDLGPVPTRGHVLGFKSCGDCLYFYPVSKGAVSGPLPYSPEPLPFYRIRYSDVSHIKYESAVSHLAQQGKWFDALGLCLYCGGKDTSGKDSCEHKEGEKRNVLSREESSYFEGLIKNYADIAVCRHSLFLGTGSGQRLVERNGRAVDRIVESIGTRVNRRTPPRFAMYESSDGENQSYSHYQLTAQVCIQFCTALSLTDILYSDIYEMFIISGQESVFLRTLASHLVASCKSRERSGALRSLPIHVITNMEKMADYHEDSYRPLFSFNFALLERCVLSLDMQIQTTKYGSVGIPETMLRHNLISGFLYSYSCGGLDDVGAFKKAFDHHNNTLLANKGSSTFESISGSHLSVSSSSRVELVDRCAEGYKLLLFLLHSFSSLHFPTGTSPEAIVPLPAKRLLPLLREVIIASPESALVSQDGTPLVSPVDRSPNHYLNVLASVDQEALLHALSVGMRNIIEVEYRDEVCSLYVNLFEFVRLYDTRNRDVVRDSDHRSMTEAYFHYCQHDLLIGSFVLPEDVFVALIEYFAGYFQNGDRLPVVTGGVHWSAEEAVCRFAVGEISSAGSEGGRCSEGDSLARRDVVLSCLLRLHCWRAALLFDAGCCSSHCRQWVFKKDILLRAMDFFTEPDARLTSSQRPPSNEVYCYLKTLATILLGTADVISSSPGYDVVTWSEWTSYPCISDISSTSNHMAPLSEFKVFTTIVSLYFVKMAMTSMTETKELAAALYSDDIATLISATESCQFIQFELLTTIIDGILDSAGSADGLPHPIIDHDVFLKYLKLLLSRSPEGVYSFLSRSKQSGCQFPIKECLLLCTKSPAPTLKTPPSLNQRNESDRAWQSLDAVSFLKELSSDLHGAVAAVLLYMSCAFSATGVEGGRSRRNVKEMGLLTHAFDILIHLCVTEGGRVQPTPAKSGTMWFTALDSVLRIHGKQCALASDTFNTRLSIQGIIYCTLLLIIAVAILCSELCAGYGEHASSGCHPAVERFVCTMRLFVSASSAAEYIRDSSTTRIALSAIEEEDRPGDRDSFSWEGKEEVRGPLHLKSFRDMAFLLIGGTGSADLTGLLACSAICRHDLAELSRSTLAERVRYLWQPRIIFRGYFIRVRIETLLSSHMLLLFLIAEERQKNFNQRV